MSVHIFLNYAGDCREAAEFYSHVFQTEPPVYMTYGEGAQDPEHPLPQEAMNLIMYTELLIEGDTIMLMDAYPPIDLQLGNNMSLTVVCDDREKATEYFNRMKERGTVDMELQETFWSPLYGSIIDDFGIIWQFNVDPDEGEIISKYDSSPIGDFSPEY
ncbi:VOC family protein [Proteiniclasticum sp.]|uniref:VOC family protein n=1 Tax=Proteiniclasticum sp. TaxID=2053595 RepID=UPI00289955A3|nr:VOC family protein [Proteiniclasticum sp.]